MGVINKQKATVK